MLNKTIKGKYFNFEICPEEGLFALCLSSMKTSNISTMNSLDSILGIQLDEFGNLIRFNSKEVFRLLQIPSVLSQVEELCKKDIEEGDWYN